MPLRYLVAHRATRTAPWTPYRLYRHKRMALNTSRSLRAGGSPLARVVPVSWPDCAVLTHCAKANTLPSCVPVEPSPELAHATP